MSYRLNIALGTLGGTAVLEFFLMLYAANLSLVSGFIMLFLLATTGIVGGAIIEAEQRWDFDIIVFAAFFGGIVGIYCAAVVSVNFILSEAMIAIGIGSCVGMIVGAFTGGLLGILPNLDIDLNEKPKEMEYSA